MTAGWLTNAHTADGRLVDLSVVDGLVDEVLDHDPDVSRGEAVDLDGWLLLPAMAEPHAHLDKALTSERVPNPAGDLAGAIEAWVNAADQGMFTHDDIVERATAAMEKLIVSGVTAVRTHVNVGAASGIVAVRALQQARAAFDGILDVQLVALTNTPTTGPDGAGNRGALDQAVEAGVDLVGGAPHLDPDGSAAIDHALEVAAAAGIGVDLHIDELLDPDVLLLRSLARKVIATGFAYPVAASHCVTLGMQTSATQASVAAEVAEAGISVFALPQTNLFLQGRNHPTGTPRGITAVRALRDAGATVAAGADNVQDPFNLVGRSDPLETAALLVMAAHQLPDDAYAMVSSEVRRAIGLAPAGVETGAAADLVAIDAPSIRGAIADAPMRRRVFRRGRLVATSDHQSQVLPR